jgi:hypothetical protein
LNIQLQTLKILKPSPLMGPRWERAAARNSVSHDN